MPDYHIAQLFDERAIRAFLRTDEDYAAYALGDLDPPYADAARWYAAGDSSGMCGLVLHYTTLDPEVLFLMGDDTAVRTLLTSRIGPDRVYYTAKPHQEVVLSEYYVLPDVQHMYRMRVTAETFKPLDASPTPVIHLGEAHSGTIEALLRRAAAADNRADEIAFVPSMVEDGFYYGVFQSDRLIAAAGTHIVAQRSRIAAVGNVVVDPVERRRGLGAMVSEAVTRSLLDQDYDLIVLNVKQDNAPAVGTYRKLGYYVTGEFIEGVAIRRSSGRG